MANKTVHQIEDDQSAHYGDGDMYCVSSVEGADGEDSKKWYENLFLFSSGKVERFKLDTGSDLNVISLNTFRRLGFNETILKPDKTRAISFCGNCIPIAGSCFIDWVFKDKVYKLHFIISKHNCQSILGKYACEEINVINRVLSLDIECYSDLFTGLGKLPGKYKIIIDREVQPSICPVRKIPLGVRDKLLSELNRMEQLGVIRKVSHPTPWVNAIVVAAKKDGGLRVCLDPRPLNRAVRRAHYPLPTLTDIAAKLHGACHFSKLDARSGFWMVELTDDSADLCTFGTPFGRYQYLRLPYGISCASEVFHAKVRQLLEDLDGVETFVDDIVVYASTKEEHDRRLERLLERAREVGIKFNREKCEFSVQKVNYLGHSFSANGMSIDEEKIKAVENMPTPHDRPSLERFLGMVNYLSKFIPNFASVASPLRSLLRKDTEWCWNASEEEAVSTLKRLVCSAPVLALYSPHAPLVLSVDASAVALGAVLLQEGRPLEFASSTLTDTQSRYAQIEKELLAIVFGLERFHQYIFGRHDVIVETDHKPLEALFNKSLDAVPGRLQRMMLRIQGYDFQVHYKPGKYMYLADALSRAPLPDMMSEKVSEEVAEQTCFLLTKVRFSDCKQQLIKDAINKDDECILIIKYITDGWPVSKSDVDHRIRELWSFRECFEYIEGLIFKDNLVFIPRALRREMVNRVHEGHLGIDKCKRNAREVMFWPRMARDIEQAIRHCSVCTEHSTRPSREPLLPHDIPCLPWAKVGSDIFQFGKNYFLILVDYFSNYIEVNNLTGISSRSVIECMKDQFARHGIPKQVVSDNGPAYASKEFQMFCSEWGFDHITSSPNFPQSNGRSERSVRTIKNILVKSIKSGTDYRLGLLNFRSTPRDGIQSPSELLMGRRLNTRLPAHHLKLSPNYPHEQDHKKMLQNQQVSKSYYDKHSRHLPELGENQSVIIVDNNRRKYARVEGRAEQPRSYFVQDHNGKRYRRNRRHLIPVGDSGIRKVSTVSSPIQVDSDPSSDLTREGDNWSSANSVATDCNSSDELEADVTLASGDTSVLHPVQITPADVDRDEAQKQRRTAALRALSNINKMFKEN